MKILEFSIKAFAPLLKSFAGGNRKLWHTGGEVLPSVLSGGGEGRGWMWRHTDCPGSGSSAIKIIAHRTVIQRKSVQLWGARGKLSWNSLFFLESVSLVGFERWQFMFLLYLLRADSWSWECLPGACWPAQGSVELPVRSELEDRDRMESPTTATDGTD